MHRKQDDQLERVREALSKFLDLLAKKIVEGLDRKPISRSKPISRRNGEVNAKSSSHRDEI